MAWVVIAGMRGWLVAIVVAVLVGRSSAQTQLRIATLAPPGSAWDKELQRASTDLAARTQGRITITWYPAGPFPDEHDVAKKMGLRQLDGAELTSEGLAMIDPSVRMLELPGMFDSIEETDYVVERGWPSLQKRVWTNLAGRLYSKNELALVLTYRADFRAKHAGAALTPLS